MKTEIEIIYNGYNSAFRIEYISEYGSTSYYTSPFMFEDYDDAYDAAINELAN